MNELFRQKVYENVISTVLDGVPKEHHLEMQENYKIKLNNRYNDVYVNESNLKRLVEEYTQFEISFWKSVSLLSKLSSLVKDEAYFKIQKISNDGFEYAKNRLQNNELLDREKAEECIHQLNDLKEKVELFNALSATMQVSEGILDYEYASGMTDNMSLRLGRKIR